MMENRENTLKILTRYIKRVQKKDQGLFLYVVYHNETVREWITVRLSELFQESFSFSSINCRERALIHPAHSLLKKAKKKTLFSVCIT